MTIGEQGGATLIALEGKLVLGPAVNELREKAVEAAQRKPRTIIIDLSGVNYIDSAGLGALALASFTAKQSGRTLRLAGARPEVMQAIAVTKLDSVIPVFRSVDEALAAERPQPSI